MENTALILNLFWQRGFGIFILPIAIFLLVGGIVALVSYFSYKREQKRLQELQMFASQNSWTFVGNAAREMFQNYDHYSIFSAGHSRRIRGFIQKPLDDGQMMVFDYQFTTGGGKNSHTYSQTVFAFHTPHLNIPYFALYPESFFSFIGEAFGYNDIDFISHPNFSSRFKLSGQDEGPIRQIFHPQVLNAFETLPNLNTDGGGNYLFIYTKGHRIDVMNLSANINYAMNIYGLFRR